MDLLERLDTLASEPASHLQDLLELSRHEDEEVRARALEVLVEVRAPDVSARAAEALRDPSNLVRIAAAELIEDQKLAELAPLVWELAKADEDELVRQCALVALVPFQTTPSEPELLDYVATATGALHLAASYVLFRRGRREELVPLLNGLFDPSYRTRVLALNLVDGRFEDRELPFFLNLLRLLHPREETLAVRSRIEEILNEADSPGQLPTPKPQEE